ncbi:glycosyltransferase family 4 protein [Thermodesulfovibrionales bacterium]|nr:glycosyltransferase family 4 protein [Thermodesulfovibrionales bacterium]
MNIWIFNHYAITPDLPGGTRHFDLSRELVKRGHQVTIFASGFHHHQHREAKLQPKERWRVDNVDGVTFVWLKTFPYQGNDWRRVLNMVSYTLRVWRLGRRLPKLAPELEKPNVVIGSSVHLLAVLAAYRVARHYKAKFIMEVRDLWPQTLIDMGEMSERHPLTKLLQMLEKFLYRRAERIITLLPGAGEYIGSRGINKEKIVWIPNGVDLSRFAGVDTLQKAKAEGKFKVIYLGAHGRANALDVLLKATKIVQDQGIGDIHFVLVGDGPEKPRLIELAKELGLKNVEFRNPVTKSKVPETLGEADATALILNDLSLYKYGISLNKLFDYLAARKLIILAGNPVNNPVEEAHCGLTVPSRDPKALAEAVIKLYKMPKEERKAIGHRGREYVERHHAIPVLAEKLIAIL